MTQAEVVLDMMRQYGGVDLRDFPQGFRLAARINDLRNDGYDITSTRITLPGGTKAARYSLTNAPNAPTTGEQIGAFR